MKHIPRVVAAAFLTLTAIAQSPHPSEKGDEKRFVIQMVSGDGDILGVELIVARAGDEAKTPGELLEKQVGAKWWGLTRGVVYRFSERTKAWEAVMTRHIYTTETFVGALPGLKVSELRTGDVIVASGEAEF